MDYPLTSASTAVRYMLKAEVSLLDAGGNVLRTWSEATGPLNGTLTYAIPSDVRWRGIVCLVPQKR